MNLPIPGRLLDFTSTSTVNSGNGQGWLDARTPGGLSVDTSNDVGPEAPVKFREYESEEGEWINFFGSGGQHSALPHSVSPGVFFLPLVYARNLVKPSAYSKLVSFT